MKIQIRLYSIVALLLAAFTLQAQPARVAKLNTSRPWTYWWWMGSAVNEADVTNQLSQFAKAGLGGVHIIPIYGVKGYEHAFIPFLSERWLAVFAHTVNEANRLGLGVDVTTGTGWPFGGPNVSGDMAAKQWKVENGQLTSVPTKQQVKRAAPGGAGLVLDYFDSTAVRRYLQRFDSTLTRLPQKPRAVYNDSYEVYGANWTDRFTAEFKKRRGYDLNSQLTAFLDSTGNEDGVRVRQDYHQTLAELLRDGFTATWTNWARTKGYQTRNQAHGSPGNLLDLYALTDIPETESFGSSRFPIPGLRVDKNYEVDRFGTPHPLAMKFASSAAHLTGKTLVSSETGTWLADHFNVALSQIKPQIDELFTAGINHVFYHGTTYSPQAEAYPGWLFYASTNYGPSSHLWPHLPLLNQYVERCQRLLQQSKPDNDVLVYFPIHDLWAKPAKSAGGVHMLEVHHAERWLLPLPFGRLGEQLQQRGFSFDYVSDELMNRLTVGQNGSVRADGATYRVIVVPAVTYIPETTLQKLLTFARQGVRIVFEGTVPKQAAGFYNWQQRTANIASLGKALSQQKSVLVTADVVDALERAGARREPMAEAGLSFVRKKTPAGETQYFITNLSDRFRAGWVNLATTANTAFLNDPLTDDQHRSVPMRKGAQANTAVYLRLPPGKSCFVTLSHSGQGQNNRAQIAGASRRTDQSTPKPLLDVTGTWQVQFLRGRPALTGTMTLPKLVSWTTAGGADSSDSAAYFSGTARYTTTFDVPATTDVTKPYRLELGDVREVADVQLNGQPLGTVWCLPFELTIAAGRLKPGTNQLVIDVTNLSANYMRLYDRQHPEWKKFYDINIVDIRYRPFDAAQWEPVPSGLLGPVRLLP
ncbi:glycosyl hydrolase [Spirosoma knui]